MLRSLRIDWHRSPDRRRYPFDIPAIASLQELAIDGRITILVGANGSGKSTILEAIAVQLRCNPEGGSPNFNFSTADTLSDLHGFTRLVKSGAHHRDAFFYRADSYYNVASEMRKLDAYSEGGAPIKAYYGGDDLHSLSHGQSVMRLLRHRFRPRGVYVMDEPEAALAPETQLEVIAAIVDLTRQGAQFILATHSPLLMAIPNATIYELSESGIEQRVYHELRHVRLYKRFLNDPASMLAMLLDDEEQPASE